jgi:dTDP-4-dehydrorhamnose reductase
VTARPVFVIGSAGRLGAALVRSFEADHPVIGWDRDELDVTDPVEVRQRLAEIRPSIILNGAAFTDVDGAEDDPVVALEVNAFAVDSLARAATEFDAPLVHFSTDFVFDGTADRPYTEDDRPNPRSVYAASKLVGEWLAARAPRWYVLRIESLFGSVPGWAGRRSSVDAIVEGIEQGAEVPVFSDRTVSPSYVPDIVQATRRLLEGQVASGVYHCVNGGQCTWQELAETAARGMGRTARLRPMLFDSVTLRAKRPKFCALSNARLASVGIQMPHWTDALTRHLASR